MLEIKHKDNGKKGEFYVGEEGHHLAEMAYTWAGDTRFIIDHTEVEPDYNGKGVGKEMVLKAVDFARKNNLKIIPLCPFAKATFDKNPDLGDVL